MAAEDDAGLRSSVDRAIAATEDWRSEFAYPIIDSVRRGETVDLQASEDGERYQFATTAALDELEVALVERRMATAQEIDEITRVLIAAHLRIGRIAIASNARIRIAEGSAMAVRRGDDASAGSRSG